MGDLLKDKKARLVLLLLAVAALDYITGAGVLPSVLPYLLAP